MLLKTRFYLPPVRPNAVVRHRLLEPLANVQGGELLTLLAPAGYGKTTLVSQWLRCYPHVSAWLALDQTFITPALFWRYLIQAMQNMQPNLGQEALVILNDKEQRDFQHVVVSLLNDLDSLTDKVHSTQAITLVLDDFHLVDNSEVLEQFNLFLDHLPPSIRLILITRSEPDIAFARRLANNQMKLISTQDLVFTHDEALAFLKETMGLALDASQLESLEQTTEGWIAALQLAALALQQQATEKQSFNSTPPTHQDQDHSIQQGIDRHITDYLFNEVLNLQPDDIQDLLLKTALVDKFCAGLINRLLETHHGVEFINDIERRNLFLIALDNHQTWYRFHDLFKQFLNNQLTRLTPPEITQLQKKAVEWFEEAGYLDEAIHHSIRYQQWQKAIALLEMVVEEKLSLGHYQILDHWIAQVPKHELHSPLIIETQKRLRKHPLRQSHPPQPHKANAGNSLSSEPLTEKEKEVMSLIAQGLTNKEIAEAMQISLNTLKVHIRNLYGKMGVENRQQALLKSWQT